MIFSFRDYREWLKDIISTTNVRGTHARLADAAGCQRAFLSQVINGTANLTADHAAGIAEYLGFDEAATEYLQALVTYARASSKSLRSFLDRRLTKLAEEHRHLGKRLKNPAPLDHLAFEYYSDWTYAAIHMLATIPKFQNEKSISERLRLEPSIVKQRLRKLEQWGFLRFTQSNEWQITQTFMHIPTEHPMTSVHHRNWRLKAADQSRSNSTTALQFTGVCSLSHTDLMELKNRMTEFILATQKIVSESEEEELVCISLDLFTP